MIATRASGSSSLDRLNAPARRAAQRLLLIQCAIALLCAGVALFWSGLAAAGSALLGGAICIIPNGIFAWLALRHAGARAARQIARAFYLGEALKLILTGVLFAAVLVLLPVVAPAVLVSFIVCLQAQWFAPLLFTGNK